MMGTVKPHRHAADIPGTNVTAVQNPKHETRKQFNTRVEQLFRDHSPPDPPPTESKS